MDCELCDFRTYAKDNIFETGHWVVTLASEEQAYLGRAYVKLRRHCTDLADLTGEEWNELHRVIGRYERAVRSAFGADLFNWACLMNGAFQHDNPSPHVHFHVRPRYKSGVEFAGAKFEDTEFGYNYSRERKHNPGEDVAKKIVEELKRNDRS